MLTNMGSNINSIEQLVSDGNNTRRTSNASDKRSSSVNVMAPKAFDLDNVLVKELGQFGRFQLYNMIMLAFPIMAVAFASDFIFSAAAIPHRCRIPECGETTKDHTFNASWLVNAIPETQSGFASCERFVPAGGNGTLDYCPANLFTNEIQSCDGFVYERDNSLVYDFNLGCNEWLRTLAGTSLHVGTLLVLTFIGYVSDSYGRKFALVISVFNLSFIGLVRAFSVNYPMFLAMQLLQTTLGGGTFSAAYILAVELVGPKYRVLAGATCNSMYAVGMIILGGVAWLVQPWRYIIMIVHIPCLLTVSYYWILPESVRWLLSKGKYYEAKKVLQKVARLNKTEISDKSLNALIAPPPQPPPGGPGLVSAILRSKALLRRVCITPILWISMTFVYNGLSINSTTLSDTMYLNFILTVAIEIPGYFAAVFALDRIGRKPTLCTAYFLSSACNIAFIFIPDELSILRLVIYLLGKFGISAVVTALYVFTLELYPTQYRHSLLAFSSMIGRIGSITAPLTPALMVYWEGIPSAMFGALGFISGALVLMLPETLGTRMPDTLKEAEDLRKTESNTSS